ncbi:hypothetical protein [Alishewanella sp. HL-SH06]|uniref:hypothetical protein n=1 Tax=Alishewanella sp. HL-SH06 TaxID=3461144 RepID=UPI00404192B9
MHDKAAIKTVIDYCRENNLDETFYLNFIAALRLPPSYLHLRLAVEALQGEYQRASRFNWFSNEPLFTQEKLIVSNIASALKNTRRHSDNLIGLYDTFPLAVFLMLPHHESVGIVSEIYAVLKIFALRYSLEQLSSQEGSQSRLGNLGNLGNMVTEIRRHFKKTSSRNYVINKEFYSDFKSFITLLSDKNGQIWSIPTPFIDWMSTLAIAPTRSKTNNIKRNLTLVNGVTSSVKPNEKHVDVEKINNIPGKSTRYLHTKPQQVVEEDESLDEIFEFSADPEHPISLETVEQSLLYGNRLRTQERLLLSLRTNVLTEHELAIFISGCINSLQAEKEKEAFCAATLLLSFLTARNLDHINQFTLGQNLAFDTEGIDITKGIWRRKSIVMPNAVKLGHNHPILFEHSDYAALPLPTVLVRFLQKSFTAITEWSQLLRKVDVEEEQLLAYLKKIMASIPRRNTLAQIRLSLFQQLALKTDPGYAALVLATTEPLTPTPLYYKSVSLHNLQQSYSDYLREIGLYPQTAEHRPDAEQIYTGSYIAVDDTQLADFFSRSFENLTELFVQSSQTEQGVIAFLNALTCYTTVTLLACTGHRNRTEFQFEPALFNLELDMMILSDKTQYDDASIRFVPIADIAKAALVNYAKTCRALAAKLDDHHLKVALLKKGLWQQGDIDIPFLSIIKGSNVRAVSSEDVSLYLVNAGLNLPLNFFRHRLCSRLSEVLSVDAVNWILGHVGEGEHPFSLTSTLTLTDISECRQYINDAVALLNIQIWEAPSQRGLAALPLFKPSSEGYVPEYLTVKRMSFRERVKWVKDLFREFSKRLEPDESILEHLDEFMDAALNRALELGNHDDSVACVKIINRKIERLAVNHEEPQAQHWRMPLSESLVALDTRFFYEGRRVRALRERLSERIVHPDFVIDPKEAVYEVVLSVLIQSAIHFTTTDFIKSLQSERFTLNGLHFFDYRKNENLHRIYIDPLSVGLIKRHPYFSEQLFSEKRFLKFARAVIQNLGLALPGEFFSSLSEFSRYIAFYDNQSTEPALMRSFRLNKIQTNPLSQSALARLLTPGVLPEKRQLSEPKQSANYLKRHSAQSVQLLNERKFFDNFIKIVGYKRASREPGVTIKTVIPHIWAEFVNSRSIEISDLLAKSGHLSDAAIAVLLFMVDVGKRPGRRRKNISFNTIKTYFSKICVPLLDVAQEQKILAYDEDELSDLYSGVLDCRELATRPRHAEMLSDLHRCVEKHFYLPEINWFEIEPNILKKDEKRYGNILTTSDYEQILVLLRNDPYSDERTRLYQAVIFILAYRCGLRRSEIKNRLHRDLESADGLLYVFTNKHYRLKTINANRRIPATLLLNQTERDIISQLLAFSKRLDSSPKGRVFNVSDSEFAHLCSRVTEAIVTATENDNARLHDCRHSFATYMCWVGIIPEKSQLSLAVTSWCRQPPEVFLKNWMLVTTGKSSAQGHKFMATLALAMGHGSPLTTLSHYVHELPLLNLEYQCYYAENNRFVTHKNLGGWLDTSDQNTRQISVRSEISTPISLMQRIMKTAWRLPESILLTPRTLKALPEKDLRKSHLECWLEKLADFRALALADEDDLDPSQPLMNRLYELFENRQHAAPLLLMSPEGKIKPNSHIRSRVRRVLTGRKIITVLTYLAECDISPEQCRVALDTLIEAYMGNRNFFMTNKKLAALGSFEQLGLIIIPLATGVRKTGKSIKNGAFYRCQLKSVDISDEMYVSCVILSA